MINILRIDIVEYAEIYGMDPTILKVAFYVQSVSMLLFMIVSVIYILLIYIGKNIKEKLTDMLDKLDVSDKYYDRKYQDMHNRLDNLYDKIGDIEEELDEVNEKINCTIVK